jgi:hypothetical protein
VGIG